MNQQNNNGGNSGGPAQVSWGVKAGYIGTGVLIGLVAYPFVRKALAKLQPKLDAMLDELTGKVENLAEGASDLMARAREAVGNKFESAKDVEHEHNHSSDPAPTEPKPVKARH